MSSHYGGHLQGIATNQKKNAIFWSFTVAIVKTDTRGKILKTVAVKSHAGDLCYHGGRLYVATNFGRFNDPKGMADNWIIVYDADDLSFAAKHKVPEVKHGAGGIAHNKGRFFVVGGLPKGVEENYVYEYDKQFKFVKKHVVTSGYTLLGIQTAAFAEGHFWFGCYGKKLVKTDAALKLVGKYDFDCGLGVVGIGQGKFLIGRGARIKGKGNNGKAVVAVPDNKKGLVITKPPKTSQNDWPCWRGPGARAQAALPMDETFVLAGTTACPSIHSHAAETTCRAAHSGASCSGLLQRSPVPTQTNPNLHPCNSSTGRNLEIP